MSCNAGGSNCPAPSIKRLPYLMNNYRFSATYGKFRAGAPLAAIRVCAVAGNRRRGWLTASGQNIPVALGRGGIIANKREGDGGTPKGVFRPLRLWWRAD